MDLNFNVRYRYVVLIYHMSQFMMMDPNLYLDVFVDLQQAMRVLCFDLIGPHN